MSKKKNKQSNQVVKDMKECFRSFHLPVDDDISLGKQSFLSQFRTDLLCANIDVTHNKKNGYVRIQVIWILTDPLGRFNEVIKLLDLCNSRLTLDRLSSHPERKFVLLETNLFLSDNQLPIGKFNRLIHDILEHANIGFLLIADVMIGKDPKDAHASFVDGCNALEEIRKEIPIEAAEIILKDMESVFHDFGISLSDEDRFEEGFFVNFAKQKQIVAVKGMVVELFTDGHIVIVELFSSFTIPDAKIDTITESVNWINMRSDVGSMYIRRDDNQVRFRKGIIIENDVLDKMEFKKTVENFISSRHLFFDIIMTQLITGESPDVIMTKITDKLSK